MIMVQVQVPSSQSHNQQSHQFDREKERILNICYIIQGSVYTLVLFFVAYRLYTLTRINSIDRKHEQQQLNSQNHLQSPAKEKMIKLKNIQSVSDQTYKKSNFIRNIHLMVLFFLLIKLIYLLVILIAEQSGQMHCLNNDNIVNKIEDIIEELYYQVYFLLISYISYQWLCLYHRHTFSLSHPLILMNQQDSTNIPIHHNTSIKHLIVIINALFVLSHCIINILYQSTKTISLPFSIILSQQSTAFQWFFNTTLMSYSSIKLIKLTHYLKTLYYKILVILFSLLLNAIVPFVNSIYLAIHKKGISDYILGNSNSPNSCSLLIYYLFQEVFLDLLPPLILLFIVRPYQTNQPNSQVSIINLNQNLKTNSSRQFIDSNMKEIYSDDSNQFNDHQKSSSNDRKSSFSYLDNSGF